MYANGVVGHPVEPDGFGMCAYPDCGRRTGVYGGILQHRRGSGGLRSGVQAPRTPYHELRRALAVVTRERDEARAALVAEQRANEAAVSDLLERIAELTAEAHPWVSVHAKLDAILARPFGAPVVTHRRRADGGVGGKRERRGEVAA